MSTPRTRAGRPAHFFAKLFGSSTDTSSAAVKYQISLKSDGSKTLVSVLNSQGAPETGENSKRIVALLAGRTASNALAEHAHARSRPQAASCGRAAENA